MVMDGRRVHFWIGPIGTLPPVGRSAETERVQCVCLGGGLSGGRCIQRATQEDGLCDACRETAGHGAP